MWSRPRPHLTGSTMSGGRTPCFGASQPLLGHGGQGVCFGRCLAFRVRICTEIRNKKFTGSYAAPVTFYYIKNLITSSKIRTYIHFKTETPLRCFTTRQWGDFCFPIVSYYQLLTDWQAVMCMLTQTLSPVQPLAGLLTITLRQPSDKYLTLQWVWSNFSDMKYFGWLLLKG